MRTLFDGTTFDARLDLERLETQLGRVYRLMKDGRWRTLRQIQDAAGGSESAVSARLRDFRKEKFGGFEVESRRKGKADGGLWEYRVVV